MTRKEKISRDLEVTIISDDNSPTRRFFRCWLDGSYLGEQHYKRNQSYIKDNLSNKGRLRSFVISEFAKYIAHDGDCSPSYARCVVLEKIGRDNIEALNDKLIEDAKELVA